MKVPSLHRRIAVTVPHEIKLAYLVQGERKIAVHITHWDQVQNEYSNMRRILQWMPPEHLILDFKEDQPRKGRFDRSYISLLIQDFNQVTIRRDMVDSPKPTLSPLIHS